MIQVPAGKRMYIGARKFLEGEVLPPHITINLSDDLDGEEKSEFSEPPKRTYRKRSDFIRDDT